MNGPQLFESDELESDEFIPESDESDEAAEWARRRRLFPAIRTPPLGNIVPLRRQGFATRAELQATANRLDGRIATLSTGVKTLEGRVRTLGIDQTKVRTDLGKEVKERRGLSDRVNNLQQISMIMPLLTTQKTVSASLTSPATPGTTATTTTQNVVVDTGDNLSRVLPLILFSGAMGGPSGGGGGMFGGDNSGIMMLALVMAMSK